ncbi:hypothetical protein GCM10011519_26930 [Marmoricola endophyticus]|uniref:PqqD family protein n=1 Tax=Marmoricola endophyticus TaxID=2040280 RepID=A0A917BN80_9ACTN|nr:hypothetical protein [Marmoricola endophyticus]GGF51546.1 hypothetical protein GCM10011519_26930 [Marmoricola endophyticus]
MSGGPLRRVTPVDELDRDGERLVLLAGRVVHVHGLGPYVLDLLAEPTPLAALTQRLVEELGAPPGQDPGALVAAAVATLSAEGLVEEVSPGADGPAAGGPR